MFTRCLNLNVSASILWLIGLATIFSSIFRNWKHTLYQVVGLYQNCENAWCSVILLFMIFGSSVLNRTGGGKHVTCLFVLREYHASRVGELKLVPCSRKVGVAPSYRSCCPAFTLHPLPALSWFSLSMCFRFWWGVRLSERCECVYKLVWTEVGVFLSFLYILLQ